MASFRPRKGNAAANAIKRIEAASKLSPEARTNAVKLANAIAKRAKRDPISDEEREDAGFKTRQDRATQALNPNAWVSSTIAPAAPPSASGRPPLAMPQVASGASIYQGVVNQINQVANQISQAIPSTYPNGWSIIRAPDPKPRLSDARAKSFADMFTGGYDINDLKAKQQQKDIARQDKEERIKAQQDRKAELRELRESMIGRARAFDDRVESWRKESYRNAKKRRAVDKDQELGQSRATRKSAKEDRDARRNYLKMRSFLHPDVRAELDKGLNDEDRLTLYSNDLNDTLRAQKKDGSENNMTVGFRTRQLAKFALKMIGAFADGKAEFDPNSQLAPFHNMTNAISQIAWMAGPWGGPTALIGSAMIRARMEGENAANQSVEAEYRNKIGYLGFGNQRKYEEISKSAAANRGGRGRTAYEWLQDNSQFEVNGWAFAPLGNSGVDAEIAAAQDKQLRAVQNMRGESWMYGNGANKAIAQYSRQSGIPTGNIAEYKKNELIDKANEGVKKTIIESEGFKKALDDRVKSINFFQAGYEQRVKAMEDDLYANVILNPELAHSMGINTPAFNYRQMDERVKDYLKNHGPEIQNVIEQNRIVELHMKAERHRHLAEF